MAFGYPNVMDSFKMGYQTSPAASIGNAIRGVVQQHEKLAMMQGQASIEEASKGRLMEKEYGLKAGVQADIMNKFGDGTGTRQVGGASYDFLPNPSGGGRWAEHGVDYQSLGTDIQSSIDRIRQEISVTKDSKAIRPKKDALARGILQKYGKEGLKQLSNFPEFSEYSGFDPVKEMLKQQL